MVKKIGARQIFSLCILLVFAGFAVFSMLGPSFRLSQIEVVSGSEPLRPFQEMELKAIFDRLLGRRIWSISADELHSEAAILPWVEQVEVRRVLPDKVSVNVRPKLIAAWIADARGELHGVSFWGELLPSRLRDGSVNAPVMTGSGLKDSEELRRKAAEFLFQLPNQGILSRETVNTISYENKKGFVIFVEGQSGAIVLGTDDLHAKAQRVRSVLEYLKHEGTQAKTIDASLEKKVLVRLRKGP